MPLQYRIFKYTVQSDTSQQQRNSGKMQVEQAEQFAKRLHSLAAFLECRGVRGVFPGTFTCFVALCLAAAGFSAVSGNGLYSASKSKFTLVAALTCSICRTHVRHVMPIYAVHLDGSERSFPCLCTRCFEGEKGLSSRIVMRLGATSLIYDRDAREKFELTVQTKAAGA